ALGAARARRRAPGCPADVLLRPDATAEAGAGMGARGASAAVRHGMAPVPRVRRAPAFAWCTGAAARPWSACIWRRWKGGPGRMRATSSRCGSEDTSMTGYVHPTEQLVTEILVRDIRRSRDFYTRLGFELLRDGGDFI